MCVGANPVRILHLQGACFAPSLHSPSNTCCGGWKPRVIVQDPELWPSASAPTLNRGFSWGCSAGWHRALEFPSPLGSRIPSQQLPTPFGVSSLCSPSGALGVRKFKCDFAFLLSWYSVAGGVSEKGCEASWSEMWTSWNQRLMRPEGSSQGFRVHDHHFDLCSLS